MSGILNDKEIETKIDELVKAYGELKIMDDFEGENLDLSELRKHMLTRVKEMQTNKLIKDSDISDLYDRLIFPSRELNLMKTDKQKEEIVIRTGQFSSRAQKKSFLCGWCCSFGKKSKDAASERSSLLPPNPQ